MYCLLHERKYSLNKKQNKLIKRQRGNNTFSLKTVLKRIRVFYKVMLTLRADTSTAPVKYVILFLVSSSRNAEKLDCPITFFFHKPHLVGWLDWPSPREKEK